MWKRWGVCGLLGAKHSPIQDILIWLLPFHQTLVIQISKIRRYSDSWRCGRSVGLGVGDPVGPGYCARWDTRGCMWIVGGETFTHSRHIDMVATFSPDFSNPDVQVKEVREFRCREVREVWEIYTSWTTWTSQLFL